MFDVSAQVLVELGLQLAQFLLSLPHVFLQLQARLSGVVVASCQSSAVAHLVAWKVTSQYLAFRKPSASTTTDNHAGHTYSTVFWSRLTLKCYTIHGESSGQLGRDLHTAANQGLPEHVLEGFVKVGAIAQFADHGDRILEGRQHNRIRE